MELPQIYINSLNNFFFSFKIFLKISTFLNNIVVANNMTQVQISLWIVTSKAPRSDMYLKKIVPNTPHHKDPMVAYIIPFLKWDCFIKFTDEIYTAFFN